MTSKVVWHEGMFLLPHHFQQHDYYWQQQITERPMAVPPYAWGISELEIDTALLAQGKFAIKSAQGILPDGTMFAIPNQDPAPLARDLLPEHEQQLIYLSLPLLRPGTAELSLGQAQAASLHRYRVAQLEVTDNNAREYNSQPVQVAHLALQLHTQAEDRTGYSCLPIAQIKTISANLDIKLAEDFIAPCLNIHAVPPLKNLVQEIVGLLRQRGDALAERILAKAHQAEVTEITDFMLLQWVNRWQPLYEHWQRSRFLAPETLYQNLLQLLGELATFMQTSRRPQALPNYLHHQLTETFNSLLQRLRHDLSTVLEETATALPLTQASKTTWVAPIADKHLLENNLFILAVQSELAPELLATRLPAQIKLSAIDTLKNLVSRGLPGIEIWPLATAPRQIPLHANYQYFALNKANKLWSELLQASALAMHVVGDFPELKLELWAIKE